MDETTGKAENVEQKGDLIRGEDGMVDAMRRIWHWCEAKEIEVNL
ncbi:hypothetical protein C5167_032901 [Papaver somniferum]|uniref:Uncharacterized protein n=1 Tax=Papaver somniferum TaxID=3469 RepID=A0A4Y7KAD4_PAPSO|nr:hypothetical protein C5167_032901 [Papaver somniferum]